MFLKTMKFMIAVAALMMCGSAFAQDCGSCGDANYVGDTCGRGISHSQAAALWAGYCTESCGIDGGSMFSRDRGCGGGRFLQRDNGCGVPSNDCGIPSNDCGAPNDGCSLGNNGILHRGNGGCSLGGGGGLLSRDRGCGGSAFGGLKDKFSGMFAGGGSCVDQGCFGYPTGGCGGCGGGCDGGCGGGSGGGLLSGLGGGGLLSRGGNCGGGCGGGLLSHFGNRNRGGLMSRNDCGNGCGGGGLLSHFGNRGGGLFNRGGGCGCSGGGLFGSGGLLGGRVEGGSLFGGCNDGCNSGCDSGCKLFSGMGGKLRGKFSGLRNKMRFSSSAANCGCNNAYFGEMVGPEYGTTGMQSSVSGCATTAVSGCGPAQNVGSVLDPSYATPQLNPGDAYIGEHVPNANAKEIVGEAIEEVTNPDGN